MSWGERSCKECKAPDGYCDNSTCNVDCPYYVWDEKTKPDSMSSKEYKKHSLDKKIKLIPNQDFAGLKFCIRCKAMKSKSHIKKCKKGN